MILKDFVKEFKKIKGISFIAFDYTDRDGEKTKRLINIGVPYENALKKDLAILKKARYSEPLKQQARRELMESIKNSLNPNYDSPQAKAQKETYINLGSGLKWHIEKQQLYIFGTSVRKVITEKVEKADTRRPLTKAKDEIKKGLHTSKYRLFKTGSLNSKVSINGDKIEITE
jgi:hypothetical protein